MNMHNPRGTFRTKEAGGDDDALARAFEEHHKSVEAALKRAASGEDVAKLKTELEGTRTRLQELEQKSIRRVGSGAAEAAETWGEIVAKSADYKAIAASQSGKVRIAVKATMTTAANSGGALAPSDRKPGPNVLPQRRIRFRDVLTPGQTVSTAVEYPRQTTRTNAAATVAEGALKPESTLAWETITSPVRTIAHLLPASKQILDDAPMLRSVVDGELRYMLADVEERQLLLGSGTGTDLSGVYTQATAFAPPFTVPSPTWIDVLLLAIAQTQAAGFDPDSITLNPLDWARIISIRNAAGDYMGDGPFSAEQAARLWSIPVVTTQAMTQGTFLVGSSVGAQIFDRQDATVEISTEHSDFFARNLVMLRAEERLALAVYRPTAFTKGTFAAAVTASTAP